MLTKMNIFGNSYIGVYCKVSEDFAFIPKNLTKADKKTIEETLKVEVVEFSIAGSTILGSLIAVNMNGIIVADFIGEEEIEILKKKKINFSIINSQLNAVGNNILANDKKALVNFQYDEESKKLISEILNVEVLEGSIAGIKTVGMCAVATNKGVLCHPKIREDELQKLKDFFNLPVNIGTVNYGMPLIGAGAIANSKGGIAGNLTTGIELGRIEDALEI